MKKQSNLSPVTTSSGFSGQRERLSCNVLKRGGGAWFLRFEGSEAVLTHSLGLLYLSHLLARPNSEPIHAITLSLLTLDATRPAAAEAPSLAADHTTMVERHSYVVERSLAIDEFDRLRRLRSRLRSVQALAENPDENPAVRQEAEVESQALQRELSAQLPLSQTRARRAVRSVRRAIVRAIRALYDARDADGEPAKALRSFAAHLERYILLPSTRHLGSCTPESTRQLAGRYSYEPPPGIVWEIS